MYMKLTLFQFMTNIQNIQHDTVPLILVFNLYTIRLVFKLQCIFYAKLIT
jgi:hypothetical protein